MQALPAASQRSIAHCILVLRAIEQNSRCFVRLGKAIRSVDDENSEVIAKPPAFALTVGKLKAESKSDAMASADSARETMRMVARAAFDSLQTMRGTTAGGSA